MPLNGRNPFMLAKIAAGVNFNGTVIYQRPFDNGAIAQWTINGGLFASNEFLLDGAPNNAQAGTNNMAYVPPVDAVQEFKIQTNSYDAQYGHTSGGIVNVSLKSGTNALHGTAYEFARRKAWDANSFQNNAVGAPKGEHYLDQYGGQIAGPVYIPKIYDGRNKTFFMFDYEKYRENTPRPYTLSVPAPEFSTGDFSKLVNGVGQQITIYDPATGQNVNGTWVRQPFAGNMIPADRINPIAKNIISYFPQPNTTPRARDIRRGTNIFDAPDKDSFYNQVLKFDQQIGSKHRFSVPRESQQPAGDGMGRLQLRHGSRSERLAAGGSDQRRARAWNGSGSFRRRWCSMPACRSAAISAKIAATPTPASSPTTTGLSGVAGCPRFRAEPFSELTASRNYFNLGQYPTGNITNTGALADELELECPRSLHQVRRGSARHPVRDAELQHRAQPERRSRLDAAELRRSPIP